MTKPKLNRKCKCGSPVIGRAFLCPECKAASRIRVRPEGKCWCGKPSREGFTHCKDCAAYLRRRQQEKKHSPSVLRSNLKARCKVYGITPDRYAEMLTEQEGKCAICRQPEMEFKYGRPQSLSIDHNHDTGIARALLCGKCNKAIGHMKEDPARLRAAAEYLERFNDGASRQR